MNFFSLLAYPASHSFSPSLHNAVFSECNADARYLRSEISVDHLSDFLSKTRVLGFSVSIPHKESVLSVLDSCDESVKEIGACNTLIQKNGKWHGSNTDWKGFSKSISVHFSVSQKTALVLGAGGASKAIIYALLKDGVDHVFVWNRTLKKAEQLIYQFSPQYSNLSCITDVYQVQDLVDIVINTTSVGMKGKYEIQSPLGAEFWRSNHTAYDIVYTPKKTVFLKECEQAGGMSLSGEDMLLYQAIEQSLLFLESCGVSKSYQWIESRMKTALSLAQRTWENWAPPILSPVQKENILSAIVAEKKKELFLSEEFLDPFQKTPKESFRFSSFLRTPRNSPHIIAEIKPASPSKGALFTSSDSVESIVQLYQNNGASAVSLLTDYPFFGALPKNISTARCHSSLPFLRKDFIISSSQIAEAHELGAQAVLLMRSVLTPTQIEALKNFADTLGIDCLVEVHDSKELESVLNQTTASIIGVNNRDLTTLRINPNTFEELFQEYCSHPRASEVIWVCESGIETPDDIEKYAKNAHAVLIGTGILQSADREQALKSLSQPF